jgi:L-ascorbate metabolism protein UlaG (beta-lactamase superfamily)
MKITKYPQSCFLIETKSKRILIDPGDLEFNEKWVDEDWKDIDVILVTHRHGDHCYTEIINKITNRNKIKVYTSQEVINSHVDLENYKIVKEGEVLDFDDIKVEVVNAIHGFNNVLKDKNKLVYENIGFIVDDGKKRAYHTSDSIAFDNNYKCDVVFIPVSNHGLVMGPWESVFFIKGLEASLAIPMHYDHPRHPVNKEDVKKEFDLQDINYKFLDFEESIEV